MIDYLLGSLSEEEQTKIEEKCFANNEFYEQITIVEAELIDSYLCKQLNDSQKKLFEEKFLTSLDGKQKIIFAKTFLNSINKLNSKDAKYRHKTEETILNNHKNIFSLKKSKMFFPLALAVSLVIAVGVTWKISETVTLKHQLQQLQYQQQKEKEVFEKKQQELEKKSVIVENRYQELNKELIEEKLKNNSLETELSKFLKNTSQIISIVLTPNLQRDSSKTKLLQITDNRQLVQLKLILELQEEQKYSFFQVVVKTVEGKTVWQQKLDASKTSNKSISITLKTKILTSNDYIVTLSGVDKDKQILELADYYFRVLVK
jgi:hypothetical protein